MKQFLFFFQYLYIEPLISGEKIVHLDLEYTSNRLNFNLHLREMEI